MNFDLENTITQEDGYKIEYGLIYGNNRVIIIKAGAGGSHIGYEEKYLKIARRLYETHGCTVLCLSNYASDSFERGDVAVIRELLAGMGGEIQLYYVGNSNGSTQGLLNATQYFDFRRMVLVNMPLMMNFHKIKEALTVADTEIRFVYGEKDPSISYVPFLRNAGQKEGNLAQVEIVTVKGADHNFAGMTDAFMELCTGVVGD
jgi:pimeloyl-ACP methyl ester carboxylesterase